MRTRLLIVLCFITAICSARSNYDVNLDSILTVLNREIEMRDIYNNRKETHTVESKVRSRLKSERDNVANFDVLDLLYEEYRHYQSDSAFYYSNRLYSIAEKSGDETLMSIARSTKFDYFMSVWMLDDAFGEYEHIRERTLVSKGQDSVLQELRLHVLSHEAPL